MYYICFTYDLHTSSNIDYISITYVIHIQDFYKPIKKEFFMQKITQILFFVFVVIFMTLGFKKAIALSEIRECNNLQKQSEEYPSHLFYITVEQNEMCFNYDMSINARVQ